MVQNRFNSDGLLELAGEFIETGNYFHDQSFEEGHTDHFKNTTERTTAESYSGSYSAIIGKVGETWYKTIFRFDGSDKIPVPRGEETWTLGFRVKSNNSFDIPVGGAGGGGWLKATIPAGANWEYVEVTDTIPSSVTTGERYELRNADALDGEIYIDDLFFSPGAVTQEETTAKFTSNGGLRADGLIEWASEEARISRATVDYIEGGLFQDGTLPKYGEFGHNNPEYFEVIADPTSGNPLGADNVLHFMPTGGSTSKMELTAVPLRDEDGPGKYTLSAWEYATSDYDGTGIYHSRWYDESNNVIGTTGSKNPPPSRDQWVKRSATFDTGTSDPKDFNWYVGYSQSSTAGDLYVTGLSVEPGDKATPYGGEAFAVSGNIEEGVTF